MQMEKGKKWIRDHIKAKDFKKWFTRDNLILLILMGILLMIIAMPSEKQEKLLEPGREDTGEASESPGNQEKAPDNGLYEPEDSGEEKEGAEKNSAEEGKAEGKAGFLSDRSGLEEYTAYLEERLTRLLSKIAGVGKVNVMITLQSSEELVLEKDMPIVRSNTTENDGEGGSRSIYQVDSGESTVYTKEENSQIPYVIKTMTPRIEGVVVAAQGAGAARLSADITEAVQALFGIEANRVKVVRMASE